MGETVVDADVQAVVLLSGGMDSATVAAYVASQHTKVLAVTFDYKQRHRAELLAAQKIATNLGLSHRLVSLDLSCFSGSALLNESMSVPEEGVSKTIPVTYVPARNLIFLSIGLGIVESAGAYYLYLGINAVDYSGYPDCRPEFLEAFQRVAQLATKAGVEGKPCQVHAPLLNLTKAEVIKMGAALNLDYRDTVSCYQANAEGLACGRCDACRLRQLGFQAAGMLDQTRYLV